METQNALNSQGKLEKERQSWKNQAPWLQTMLQSYTHQNSVVLTQKHKYRSMEQDRKPRNKPIHLWSINLQQRRQEYTMEKKQCLFNEWCWAKWTATCKRMKIRTFSNTMCVCLLTQLCPTLCDPLDCSSPYSSFHGILQARLLEWVAISSSKGASQPRDQTHVSCISLHWQADSLPLIHLGSPSNTTIITQT